MSALEACERLFNFRPEETIWMQSDIHSIFTGEADNPQPHQWIWDGKVSGHLLAKLSGIYTLFTPERITVSTTTEDTIDPELSALLQSTVPLPKIGLPYGYAVNGILQCLTYWKGHHLYPGVLPSIGFAVFIALEAQLSPELLELWRTVNIPLFWRMVEQGSLVNLRSEIKESPRPVTWHLKGNHCAITFNDQYFIDTTSGELSAEELRSLLSTWGPDLRLRV